MRRLALLAAAVLAGALADAPPAVAIDCQNIPLAEQLEDADAAFVGRLTGDRPAPGDGGRYYRFVVVRSVKGPIGSEIEVRAPQLTDTRGTPIGRDVAIGVVATLDGSTFTTGPCSLSSPGALLAAADAPRGNAIRVAVGLLFLAVVLAYSFRRLRRRQAPGA